MAFGWPRWWECETKCFRLCDCMLSSCRCLHSACKPHMKESTQQIEAKMKIERKTTTENKKRAKGIHTKKNIEISELKKHRCKRKRMTHATKTCNYAVCSVSTKKGNYFCRLIISFSVSVMCWLFTCTCHLYDCLFYSFSTCYTHSPFLSPKKCGATQTNQEERKKTALIELILEMSKTSENDSDDAQHENNNYGYFCVISLLTIACSFVCFVPPAPTTSWPLSEKPQHNEWLRLLFVLCVPHQWKYRFPLLEKKMPLH